MRHNHFETLDTHLLTFGMKKHSGFSLLELVIVIILLIFLYSAVISKFFNLQGKETIISIAHQGALSGLKAAIQDAATLTHARAAIDKQEKLSAAISTSLGIELVYGYPRASSAALSSVAQLSDNDWRFISNDRQVIITFPKAEDVIVTTDIDCSVIYTQATSAARPLITLADSGCKNIE